MLGTLFQLKTQPPIGTRVVNDTCFLRFRNQGEAFVEGCLPPTKDITDAVNACTPTGSHGWRVRHEGDFWYAEFGCTTVWITVFRHLDFGVKSGAPDTEAFATGFCADKPATACKRRPGEPRVIPFTQPISGKGTPMSSTRTWNGSTATGRMGRGAMSRV